ncbi:MAG: M28 family metallopeptidase, partial [Ruthenibacterium sp.]
DAALESFPIDDAEIEIATLTVLEPYEKSYPVTGFKCAQNTSPEGLTAEFLYVEDALEANLTEVRGKIVLVSAGLRVPVYKRLIEAGVAGILTMTGTLLDKESETDLPTARMRNTLLHFGALPAVNLRASDAFELVQRDASKVRLQLQNKPVTLTSHNLVCTVKGTKYPNQIITFGAHYDSVPFSTGVYDNGAGSVILMELLRHFAQNPPLRTVQFVWYGAEEIGLEGSKAFVRMHEDALESYLFMVNVDVGAPVLGKDVAAVTGELSLVHFTDYFMKTQGYPVAVKQGTYSSDSIPFANHGIPAINFSREGAPGSSFIHCRNDVLKYLSAEALQKTALPVLAYSAVLVNAAVFPIQRKMPPEMVEAVDQYLFKEELGLPLGTVKKPVPPPSAP